MRPIDADALKSEFQRLRMIYNTDYFALTESEVASLDAISLIDKAPTLDYAPVRHGSVIESNVNGKSNRVFSCCGTDFTKLTMWMIPIYCPYCGALMNGGKKDG